MARKTGINASRRADLRKVLISGIDTALIEVDAVAVLPTDGDGALMACCACALINNFLF